jgi:hypothetical protein
MDLLVRIIQRFVRNFFFPFNPNTLQAHALTHAIDLLVRIIQCLVRTLRGPTKLIFEQICGRPHLICRLAQNKSSQKSAPLHIYHTKSLLRGRFEN